MKSQVKFNRVPEKVLGGFGAEPGQVERGSGEGSEREALVQSQVRFNGVPEKVPEKVPGSLGAKPSHVQWVLEKVPEKVWEALVQPGQVQQGSGEGSGEGLGGSGAK